VGHTEYLVSSGPLDCSEFFRDLLFEVLLNANWTNIRIAMMAFFITGRHWPELGRNLGKEEKINQSRHWLQGW
jgi:hypothetical protein